MYGFVWLYGLCGRQCDIKGPLLPRPYTFCGRRPWECLASKTRLLCLQVLLRKRCAIFTLFYVKMGYFYFILRKTRAIFTAFYVKHVPFY